MSSYYDLSRVDPDESAWVIVLSDTHAGRATPSSGGAWFTVPYRYPHDPAVIRKILAHLGIAHLRPSPRPRPTESGAAAP